MTQVRQAGAAGVVAGELARELEVELSVALAVAARLDAFGVVTLAASEPPVAAAPTERPTTSGLVRAQARAGTRGSPRCGTAASSPTIPGCVSCSRWPMAPATGLRWRASSSTPGSRATAPRRSVSSMLRSRRSRAQDSSGTPRIRQPAPCGRTDRCRRPPTPSPIRAPQRRSPIRCAWRRSPALAGAKPPSVSDALVVGPNATDDVAGATARLRGLGHRAIAPRRPRPRTRRSRPLRVSRAAAGWSPCGTTPSRGALGRALSRSLGRRVAQAAITAGDAATTHRAVVGRLRLAARTSVSAPEFSKLAATEAERLQAASAEQVLAEMAAPHWEPLEVSEVAAAAARVGLAYLGELEPTDRWRDRLPEPDRRRVIQLGGTALASQQQAADDLFGAAFHTSLFVRGSAPKPPIGGGARRPVGPAAEQWFVRLRWEGEWPELPREQASIGTELTAHGGAMTVGDLAARTGGAPDAVRQIASTLDAYGLVRLGPRGAVELTHRAVPGDHAEARPATPRPAERSARPPARCDAAARGSRARDRARRVRPRT